MKKSEKNSVNIKKGGLRMKKKGVLVGVILVSILMCAPFLVTKAVAGEQLGTYCWRVAPYVDLLQLAVTDEGDGIYLLVGREGVPLVYLLPCVGTGVEDGQGNIKMGLHCTNDTAFFGGINDCVFKSTLDMETLRGDVEIDCGTGAFTNTGTLVPRECAPDEWEAYGLGDGPVAGE